MLYRLEDQIEKLEDEVDELEMQLICEDDKNLSSLIKEGPSSNNGLKYRGKMESTQKMLPN